MRKLLVRSLALVALSALALPQTPQALAQEPPAPNAESQVTEEGPAPAPEAPYPGAAEEGFKEAAPQATGTPPPATEAPQSAPPRPLERPMRVDDEGNYYYDTRMENAVPSGQNGQPKPMKTTPGGEFIYDTRSQPPKFNGKNTSETPLNMNAKGEFFYPVETSPRSGMFSFRLGAFSPPALENPDNGVTFEKMYGANLLPVAFLDYEWRLTDKLGSLGIKLTSGIMSTNAKGHFKDKTRVDEEVDERFTFLMMPNQLTAVYRFRYSETQLLTPYIEGGAGYFTFLELRDDNKPPRYGGSAVAVGAGGLNFLLDWIDPASIRELDSEWGVNHVWLTLEFRVFQGLNKTFDFTSNVANAGFLMEF